MDSRYALAVCLTAALTACAPGAPKAIPADLKGPRLVQAFPKPNFVLQRNDGTPFDFRAETKGYLTFLFFGYTNCPDVCPLHMNNLASVLHGLPPETAKRVRLVFVTTDPERDTPEHLQSWLAKFDSSFVGLRGADSVVNLIQRSLGMPGSSRDAALPTGGYTVSHGAHLWAFTPDDSAHVVYPMGMQRDDIAADIPKLLQIWPGR